MATFLANWFFDPIALSPHGFCLLWEPGLIWSFALGDAVTALAYLAIPVALARFLHLRPDFEFKGIFWLFAAFIVLCGTTHILDLITIWAPVYRLEALSKNAFQNCPFNARRQMSEHASDVNA